jgi:drug/metabolite transporter (DMT)-like permease
VLVRLGVLAAVLFWGVSFVATKAAVAELSPGALVFARAGLGTLVLVGILAVRRRPIVPPRESWAPSRSWGSWASLSMAACRPMR